MYSFPVIDEGDAIYHLGAGLWNYSEETVEAFRARFNTPYVPLLVTQGTRPQDSRPSTVLKHHTTLTDVALNSQVVIY